MLTMTDAESRVTSYTYGTELNRSDNDRSGFFGGHGQGIGDWGLGH